MSMRYLTARLAQQIDEELMGPVGAFSIDQLMELAGLACAQTVVATYPRPRYSRVLVCCGPGNQGGDGLVAARHLSMFGYKPTIYMPKPGGKDLYKRLQTQCANLRIPTLPSIPPSGLQTALNETDVILDAIFGFSFKPPVRPPFDEALRLIGERNIPIVSVDIPSGWDVEKGKPESLESSADGEDKVVKPLEPNVLLSLTAPKEGVRQFKGKHFLGGRFVPPDMDKKFGLNLPQYPGSAQIVDISDIVKSSGEGNQKL